MKKNIKTILFFLFAFIHFLSTWAIAMEDWYIAIYGAEISINDLRQIAVFKSDFVGSYFIDMAIGKELFNSDNDFAIEAEMNLAKHIGGHRFECQCAACSNPGYHWGNGRTYENRAFAKQTHFEFNAALIFRWLNFPWDHFIDTSIAVGEGFSYAFEDPPAETDYHAANHDDQDDISKWLNYLMFEYSFALPTYPQYSLFFRVHHRSGIYGLFNHVNGGSNAIGIGLRFDL